MNEQYIAYAIPAFMLLIVVELLVNRAQRGERYSFADSITSLSCGVGQQVISPFLKGAILFGYVLVYERFALLSIASSSVVAWLVLLFGVDLGYYLFHRASHRVNFIWAGHVVHHQSEEYNLTTALRQSWFVKLVESGFYLPLALVGFPPEMFLTMTTANTLYQFWIHTRAIKTLGPLEWFMNTPSHHRVHHGINPKYIDKNYAGIFIIWDRLFGTFQREEEEPVYGTVKPLASFNPVWANVHYWAEMYEIAARSSRFVDRLKVWFMPPEWRPRDLGGDVTIPEASRDTQVKYAPPVPRGLALYVAAQFVVVGAATNLLLVLSATTPRHEIAVATMLIVATLVSWGALLEAKRWAVPLELARLAAVPCAVAWITRDLASFLPMTAGAAAMSMAFGVWVARYRTRGRGCELPATAAREAASP